MTGKTKEEIIARIKANESKGIKKFPCGIAAANSNRAVNLIKNAKLQGKSNV